MAQSVTTTAAAQWSADTIEIVDADGVVTLIGADPTRRTVTVYTDPSSIGTLYLVPNSGQRRGGVRIVPGAGFNFTHGGAIYGRAEGGAVTVSIVSESGETC